jgi:hypothetical protein
MPKRTAIPAPMESLADTKLRLEIQNLQDNGLTNLEKLVKRRIVPIFLPFLTLLVTLLIFYINFEAGEKAKAVDRYNSEIDILKIVWEDMKKDSSTKEYKASKLFLAHMYNDNIGFYKNDSIYLGIGRSGRPIKILIDNNPAMQEIARKIETNNQLTQESKKGEQKRVIIDQPQGTKVEPVVAEDKSKIVQLANQYAADQLKLYIQYSNKDNKQEVEELANRLKINYIVPSVEYVNNSKSGYDCEVRYYNSAYTDKAKNLALNLKSITGLDFQLLNIKNNNIANTMEIWYNNVKASKVIPTVARIVEKPVENYKIIYEDNLFTAPHYFIQVTDAIAVSVNAYNDKAQQATFRINSGDVFLLKKGAESVQEINGYRITLKVNGYERIRSFRKMVLYSIRIEQKQTKIQS